MNDCESAQRRLHRYGQQKREKKKKRETEMGLIVVNIILSFSFSFSFFLSCDFLATKQSVTILCFSPLVWHGQCSKKPLR
jgi:translation elongation factor EF-Ts